MTPQDFLTEAERRLAAERYRVERRDLPGGPAVVGQRKPFRVQWVLTQLKTTVTVAAVDHVSAADWDVFVRESYALAKKIKGGLPTGFQAAVGCVPVLAGTTVAPEAVALAAQPRKFEWFRGIALPALVDLSSGVAHQYDGRILVGAIYIPFLRTQRDIVTSIARS